MPFFYAVLVTSVLYDPFDHTQFMCPFTRIGIHDPHTIDLIYAHFARGVNDAVRAQQKTYMGNAALIVIEESEITDARFLQKTNGLTGFCLLVSIPW